MYLKSISDSGFEYQSMIGDLCVFGVEATHEEHRLVGYTGDGSTFEIKKLPPHIVAANKGKYFRHGGTITGVEHSGRTFVVPYSEHIEELLKSRGLTEAQELPSILGNSIEPKIVGTKRWVNGQMQTGRQNGYNGMYNLSNPYDKSRYNPERYQQFKDLETHAMGSGIAMAWNNISFLARLEGIVGYKGLQELGRSVGLNIDELYQVKRITSNSPESGFLLAESLEANEKLVQLAKKVYNYNYSGIDYAVIDSYDVSKMKTTLHRHGKEYDAVDVVLNEQNDRSKLVLKTMIEAEDLVRKLEYIADHPDQVTDKEFAEIEKQVKYSHVANLKHLVESLKKECAELSGRREGDKYATDMVSVIEPQATALASRVKTAFEKAKTAIENVPQPS